MKKKRSLRNNSLIVTITMRWRVELGSGGPVSVEDVPLSAAEGSGLTEGLCLAAAFSAPLPKRGTRQ